MSYDHSHAHSHGPASEDHDDRLTYWRAMEIALRELLIETNVVTNDFNAVRHWPALANSRVESQRA